MSDDLSIAREILQKQAEALQAQAGFLSEDFTKAVNAIMNCTGRVIVTGMGKAGHVARKITATFASTGTPASFVHPAEASHGDLGMITEHDVVIMLSKSGESAELRDMIRYCKRFQIPLIAITQKPESTLARQADQTLLMVDVPEACPNQQAPTTSTTLMMALGDALAVALMKRRGFSAMDFRQYHPGGKLGGQLLAVQTVMRKGDDLPLVKQNAAMSDVQKIMSDKNFGCAIIVDDAGALAGFISDGDIRRALSPQLLSQTARDIMHVKPLTVAHDALAAAALAVMNQHGITQLLVTDGIKPVGLVRLHDILQAGAA